MAKLYDLQQWKQWVQELFGRPPHAFWHLCACVACNTSYQEQHPYYTATSSHLFFYTSLVQVQCYLDFQSMNCCNLELKIIVNKQIHLIFATQKENM